MPLGSREVTAAEKRASGRAERRSDAADDTFRPARSRSSKTVSAAGGAPLHSRSSGWPARRGLGLRTSVDGGEAASFVALRAGPLAGAGRLPMKRGLPPP